MPDFVVTQTQAEYSAYQKKQLTEDNRRGWYGVVITIIGTPALVLLFWQLHLWGWS